MIHDRAKNRRAGLKVHLQSNNVTGWTRVRTACGRKLDAQKAWIVTPSFQKTTCAHCRAARQSIADGLNARVSDLVTVSELRRRRLL